MLGQQRNIIRDRKKEELKCLDDDEFVREDNFLNDMCDDEYQEMEKQFEASSDLSGFSSSQIDDSDD